MKKLTSLLSLTGLILLYIVFLLVGNNFIYQKQRESQISQFKLTQNTQMELLTKLARESLITRDYALIEWFFKNWGKNYQKVISLTLVNSNGFALGKYHRNTEAEGDIYSSTNTIALYDGSYSLAMRSDMIGISQKLDELKIQLLLVSTGATLLVIIYIWFLFQRIAIQHLHETRLRHAAEEKLRQIEASE